MSCCWMCQVGRLNIKLLASHSFTAGASVVPPCAESSLPSGAAPLGFLHRRTWGGTTNPSMLSYPLCHL